MQRYQKDKPMSFLSKLAFFNHYAVPKGKQTTFRDYETDVKNEAAVLKGDLVFFFQFCLCKSKAGEDFVLYGQSSGKQ